MIEEITTVFGLGFVGMIILCLAWTIAEYVAEDIKLKRKRK
tara:strand:+ start:1310 stop:1432 length:123 start_codon:yes stop_codon:yes gene_type:complete